MPMEVWRALLLVTLLLFGIGALYYLHTEGVISFGLFAHTDSEEETIKAPRNDSVLPVSTKGNGTGNGNDNRTGNACPVHERYLGWQCPYGRWNNNIFQMRNVIWLAAKSNRSVIALPFYGRSLETYFDMDYLAKYLYPGRIIEKENWVVNDTELGIVSEGSLKKVEWCVSWDRGDGPCNNHGWHANDVVRVGAVENLLPYLASNNSRTVEVLCAQASFFYIDHLVWADKTPVIPYRKDLVEEGRRVFSTLVPISFNYSLDWDNNEHSEHAEAVLNHVPPVNRTVSVEQGASLGVHLRRTDLVDKIRVSIRDVGHIINLFIRRRNVRRIFIATEGNAAEINEIRELILGPVVVNCGSESAMCKDENLRLIIEQTVCSMTDYFLGSPFSTFSKSIILYRKYYGHPANSSVALGRGSEGQYYIVPERAK